MKKLISVLFVIALLLCSAALAEAKTIASVDPGYDLAALADGTYPVAFDLDALKDGTLTVNVYSEDCYDIVDISAMEVGDTFVLGGLDFEIESLERDSDDDLLINGGLNDNGFTLHAYEEDNCWRIVMENDENTYTNRGEATLPLAEDVAFTDSWEIGKEPVTVTGAEEVAKAITESEMDYFSPLNAVIRVENGEIVEIIRTYMP